MMVGMLRSSMAISFSWWPPQKVMSHPWKEVPESKVDETLTQCLTSYVPLWWVDDVLQPLPSVVPQPTLQGLGVGDGMSSLSDKEVH